MKRTTFQHWLLCGALGASFLAGCQQVARRPESVGCATCSGSTVLARPGYSPTLATAYPPISPAPAIVAPPPPAAVPNGVASPLVRLGAPQDLGDEATIPTRPCTAEPPMVAVLSIQPTPMARVGFAPVAETGGVAAVQKSAPTLPAPVAAAAAAAAAEPTSIFPRGESPPARKSFVDLTAAPCFSHAPDYNWIIGQIEYSRIAKEWRLRYASVDELDDHGGRVILIENHHVSLLQDGQFVHVHGHLVNADNSGAGPAHYRIESFKTLADSNALESSSSVK